MRGVDLTTFDFDYDLTWAAFFMNANEHIYGRYGGRDEGPVQRLRSPGSLERQGLRQDSCWKVQPLSESLTPGQGRGCHSSG
jgi:hypothetical protein